MPTCLATKKDGTPCKAPAVTGETQCAGHLGRGLAADPSAYAKRGSNRRIERAQARAEARSRTAKDWIAHELEGSARELVGAVKAKALEGDWRAFAWLYETVYGRPQERLEVKSGSIAEIAGMSAAERRELRARLIAEHPELAELVPARERQQALADAKRLEHEPRAETA